MGDYSLDTRLSGEPVGQAYNSLYSRLTNNPQVSRNSLTTVQDYSSDTRLSGEPVGQAYNSLYSRLTNNPTGIKE